MNGEDLIAAVIKCADLRVSNKLLSKRAVSLSDEAGVLAQNSRNASIEASNIMSHILETLGAGSVPSWKKNVLTCSHESGAYVIESTSGTKYCATRRAGYWYLSNDNMIGSSDVAAHYGPMSEPTDEMRKRDTGVKNAGS